MPLTRPENGDPGHPRLFITAIVLAAGLSRRMPDCNKLLSEIAGRALIAHVIDALSASSICEIVVVTGHDAKKIRQAAAGAKLRFVHNASFEEGLSSSLRSGLEAISPAAHGAMICLGDMPLLSAELLDGLIRIFEVQKGDKICVPVARGRRGNPVLWPRYFFPQILESRGDAGARWLMRQHPESVHEIPVQGEGVLRDVDTASDLQDMSAKMEKTLR